MSEDNEVGRAIQRRREAAGLTQAGLAERVGVHKVSVSRWETGTELPGGRQLENIARALGCTITELLIDPAAAHDARASYRAGIAHAIARIMEALQGLHGEMATPPQSGAAEDTGQIKTPIKRITVQGHRVDTGRGGRGKRTG